jgi:integrase
VVRTQFRFAKRHDLTFADPARHLSGGRGAERILLPMTAGEIRAVEQAAVTPAQRLAIALAAVHATRPKTIRELTLDDIDLPNWRIITAGHRQRLGELTRNALLAWLGYRRATWPDTANRHVLVSRISALATGADPLHLALAFNIDHANAMAYANAARNLLTSPAEQGLSRRPK